MITYGPGAHARDRMLIAAIWLIGLGTVFLVREMAGWTWQEAWPLFVVYVGAAGAVSSLVDRNRSWLGIWAIWWPVAIVVVGTVLLLSTTGTVAIELEQLALWWPIAAIAVGVWFLIGAVLVRQSNSPPALPVSIPLGSLSAAEVTLNFGGGEMTIGRADPGTMVSGRFEGGVRNKSSDPARPHLEPVVSPWPFWWDKPLHWDLGITDQIPVDLILKGGASRSNIDLSALRIRRLELKTGASETRVRLPSTGMTSVRADAGIAAVNMEVPAGVAARIRSKMAIGTTTVDESRFPRSFDGWASPDYETAPNKVEIEVQGGLGAFRIS